MGLILKKLLYFLKKKTKKKLNYFFFGRLVPLVVGALGCSSKGFSGWMDTICIKLIVRMVQKSVLLAKTRILRKVLDM